MIQGDLPTDGTLFLTDADVRAAFDWKEAAASLQAAYRAPSAPAMYPPRTMARGDGVWLRTLSGVAADGSVMGAKLIAASPKAKAASYLIPLFDQASMALVALMDANSITGFRTAATSAVAVDALAPNRPLAVAVIGSGFEAKTHIRALAAIRALTKVTVFSPNPSSRSRFINELEDLGVPIEQAESGLACISDADLIICAARSRDESPTLRGEWIRPGVTVVSIGSTLPEQRELDAEAIRRADLIVADMPEEVAHDTGDMLAAAAEGVQFHSKLIGLDSLIGGSTVPPFGPERIVLYKSVGGAIQDLTVAALCARRAHALGLGVRLPVTITPVSKGK